MIDVVALGELLIDFAAKSADAGGYPTMAANPGGAPGNFLAALGVYGCKTAFIGKVGADTFGRLLRRTMQHAGIETKGIVEDPEVFTTLAFVTFDASGDRSFSFARKPGADTQLRWDEVNLHLIDEARVFHFGTLSLTDEPARSTTQQAVAYAKAKGKLIPCAPNLLRNWYFGRPVNQRGVSGTISTAGYFLDGWKLVSGSVTIGADGITLNGTMAQVLEDAPVGTVTATVLTEEGVVPVGYDSITKTFTVTAAGTKLIAAKLELGDVQTLAHLYGGAWVLNQLPDYGAELARCQRYLVPLSSDLVQAVIIGTGIIFFFVPLPVTMRATPTIVVDDFKVRSVMGGTDQTGFTFAVTAARANGVMISAAKASHGMTAAALNAGAVSLLSAEL